MPRTAGDPGREGPVHDHVDWLGVDVVGDDFGVFAEKVKDCVGGGVPGDLLSISSPNIGNAGDVKGKGDYVGHFDDCPVHAFGEFTEILEGDGFFCVVHDGCFPDARGKLCSETRERLRSIHLWESQRGHVTDNLLINKESKKGYLSADDTMTSPKRIDTTGHTFRTKTAVSR